MPARSAQLIQQQLEKLQTNGSSLGLAELLRYQRVASLLQIKANPPKSLMAGAYLSAFKGRGMEFDEARHYQPGDDIRSIDWRVTARTGKTHTKVFREERERPVYILCDMTQPMRFGTNLLLKSVQAAHLSALLIYSAVLRGDKIGAILFNDNKHIEIRPRSRREAATSLCKNMVELHNLGMTGFNKTEKETQLTSPFVDACSRLHRLVSPGSLVYIVSDFSQLCDKSLKYLTLTARHNEVNACYIYDPFELEIPSDLPSDTLRVSNGVLEQDWAVSSANFRKRYQAQMSADNEHLLHQLQRNQLHPKSFSSAIALDEQFSFLQGR